MQPLIAASMLSATNATRRRSGRVARAVTVLLGCAAGLAAIPAAAGANAVGVQAWTPQITNFIEQTIQPEASLPDTFFALQGTTTSAGRPESPPVMTIGLQNAGGSKRVVFHMYNANGTYGEHCADSHIGGDSTYCWQPFEYLDHAQYRVRMERKQSDGGGTWWEATVVDQYGHSTYVAALRQPGAPGSISSSASFVQYFGPDGCFSPTRAFFLAPRHVDSGTTAELGPRWDSGSCTSPTYQETPYGGVILTIGPGTPAHTNLAPLVLEWAKRHVSWWAGLYDNDGHQLPVRPVEYMQRNEPPMGARTSTGAVKQGCDCSSFVRWAFAQSGIDVGTNTTSIWTKFGPPSKSSVSVNLPTGHASRGWTSSPPGGLNPGDLVFFGVSNLFGVGDKKGHVAIYLGDGKIIQCSSGRGSNVRSLSEVGKVTSWIRYDSVSG